MNLDLGKQYPFLLEVARAGTVMLQLVVLPGSLVADLNMISILISTTQHTLMVKHS